MRLSRRMLLWPARALLVALPFGLLALLVGLRPDCSGSVASVSELPTAAPTGVLVPAPPSTATITTAQTSLILIEIQSGFPEPIRAGESKAAAWTCAPGTFRGMNMLVMTVTVGSKTQEPLPAGACPWAAGTLTVDNAGPSDDLLYAGFPDPSASTAPGFVVFPLPLGRSTGRHVEVVQATGVDCRPISGGSDVLLCTLTDADARVTFTTVP